MACQQIPYVTEDPYIFTDSSTFSSFFALPAPQFTPMKSTDKLPTEGKYNASIQSAHELNKASEPVKNTTGFSASNKIKLATGRSTIKANILNEDRTKSNATSLCSSNKITVPNVDGWTASQNKPKDWFSTAKIHSSKVTGKDVPRRDTLSDSAQFDQQQINTNTNVNADVVSNSHPNHSNTAKVTSAAFQSINSLSNGSNRPNSIGEHKHSIANANVTPKLKASADSNRATKQNNSFNGNGELATDVESQPESLHNSITNQSNIVNSSALKINDTSKTKKSTLSERKYKHKDAKSLHEKRKNGSKHSLLNGYRKNATNPIQGDPLQNETNGAVIVNDSNEKCASKRLDKEWHSPESYIYDDISTDTMADCPEQTSCMQTFWFRDIPNENLLTREQRLENKRDNLRRQAFQYAQAQHFRSTALAKRRLITVTKALAKFKNERNKASPTKCSIQTCSNAALAMTAYCYLHITLNKDQKLFHPCTAKFSDNSQCRVPVFDISHELPLCREHAWKRDNYNRILQEQKPKKIIKMKTKVNETVRQPKRNKKKKRRNQLVVSEATTQMIPKQQLKTIGQLNAATVKQQNQTTASTINVVWNQDLFRKGENAPTIISAKSPSLVTSVNKYLSDNVMVYQLSNSVTPNVSKIKIQNIVSMGSGGGGENSSAYESSEDTGVGKLSESELITAQDGIEIPLGDARLLEEHDLTNVLNQLPVDAFNDLFQVQQHDHYEPTQKEQDELARALEEVDEQVKSLEQMTSSSNFLDNFLDVNDEILVDSSDMCDELTTSSVKNDIRGLVHT